MSLTTLEPCQVRRERWQAFVSTTNPICILSSRTYKIEDTNSPAFTTPCRQATPEGRAGGSRALGRKNSRVT